jgi:hypothetical protein
VWALSLHRPADGAMLEQQQGRIPGGRHPVQWAGYDPCAGVGCDSWPEDGSDLQRKAIPLAITWALESLAVLTSDVTSLGPDIPDPLFSRFGSHRRASIRILRVRQWSCGPGGDRRTRSLSPEQILRNGKQPFQAAVRYLPTNPVYYIWESDSPPKRDALIVLGGMADLGVRRRRAIFTRAICWTLRVQPTPSASNA